MGEPQNNKGVNDGPRRREEEEEVSEEVCDESEKTDDADWGCESWEQPNVEIWNMYQQPI